MADRDELHRTGRDASVRALRRQVGQTVPMRRGLHVAADDWTRLAPYERYARRVSAAVSALRDPVLCFESAAVRHALPVFGEPRDIHLLHMGRGHSYRRGDVLAHTSMAEREIVRVDGVRMTSKLETAIDLARVLPLAFGVAVVDAALRSGLTSDDLERRIRELPNRRGARLGRAALKAADARSESVLESVSRVVLELLGFESPEPQVEFVVNGRVRRVDAWWRSVRVIGEADGRAKYAQPTDSSTALVLREERRRENALQIAAGRVIRWEWSDVVRVEPFERILVAAGIPRVRPRSPEVFAAVRNPRSR
ncbi:hypothetical protein [Microbacterium sp. JZ37]|uniref:hypothetical protein n=1 Tax=Microbacterium sp. JZ37 TaxID=2654193 RepID=UPI002B484108|nr:hypothetical protein [Microbacterium sp. JZ37]WRH17171.1 hypothetical protein GC092_06300 [Microbacterium sp. JZ37]